MELNNHVRRAAAAFVLIAVMQACSKDDPAPTFNYEVPATYNFTNVKYKESASRLVMLAQIETLLNSGNKLGGGINIDATKLSNMFTNTGSPFGIDSLDKSGLQLKDQAKATSQDALAAYLLNQATISRSIEAAVDGTAGVGTTKANTYILLNDWGWNNRQFFTKTAMGSLISYQIRLLVTDNSLDNNTVVSGQGTAMEHAWDVAFGYFNVPKDFPNTTTGVKYVGSYCNQVNAGIGSNAIMMNAFLKGRAAISAKDIETKKAQSDIIVAELEVIAAAAAIHEIAEAKESLDDDIQRVSRLSECMAFVTSLQYFENRLITDAQITNIINANLHGGHLYDVTVDDMNNLVTAISSIYKFTTPEKI
jgi:hypothetical protein